MSESVNVLALVRGEHRFIFLYDDESVDTLLETLNQHAEDPELDFSWHDAAVLAQRAQNMLDQQRALQESDDSPIPGPHSPRTSFQRHRPR